MLNVFLYSWIWFVTPLKLPIAPVLHPDVSDPNQFAGTSLIL